MAHYDCTDCGASYGIGYGICKKCTPEAVLEAALRYASACTKAETAWIERTATEHKEFISEFAAEEKLIYDRLYEAYKPKH